MLFATIALWFALGATAVVTAAPTNNATSLPIVALDCGQTPTVCAALCDWLTQSNDECGSATLSLDKPQHDQRLAARKAPLDHPEICRNEAHGDHLLRCGDCRDYTGSGECSVEFPPKQAGAVGVVARAQASPRESNTYHDQLEGLFSGKSNGWSFIAAVSHYEDVSQCNAGYQSTPRSFVGDTSCLKPSTSNGRRAIPHLVHEYTLESGTKVLASRAAGGVFLMDSNHPDGGRYERTVEVKAVPMPPFIGPDHSRMRRKQPSPNASAAVATTLEASPTCACRGE